MIALEKQYGLIVSNAISEALTESSEAVYKMQYNFENPALKDHKEYVFVPNYVDAGLVEQKMMEALHKIDKAREVEHAVMQAKIEAYELALGKFPEPKTNK